MLEIDYEINIEDEKIENEISKYFDTDMTEFIKNILINEVDKNNNYYISITVLNNREIRNINNEYRNIDRETDVISFAYGDNEDVISSYKVLGDIVLSYEKAYEQAKEYNHSLKREIYYLICHSVLHLLGYDHMNEEDKKIMRDKEEYYLTKYKINR